MEARSFQHIAPALRVFSGLDSLGHLGRELDRVGRSRAVIFCGSTLAREDALLRQVRDEMGDRCVGLFASVRAHSPLDSVMAGAQDLERLGADAVVAIGGGSAIVTARAASIVLGEGGSVESLSTSRDESGKMRSPKLLAPKLPQFVVPTTPTTAIVKAGSAVFDPQHGRRFALFDPKTRAQSVFIHPTLVASAPDALVKSAGLNTFSLAMEGLMSRRTEPLADALLMHALRLVRRNLSAGTSGGMTAARINLIFAAMLCGQGTDYSGAGITTVLSHATGARHHLENGLLNAIFLPYVLRFNSVVARSGLANIAAALEIPEMDAASTATKVVEALDLYWHELGLARRLRDVGVPRGDLAEIAAHAMGDWFLRDSPRPVSDPSELLQVLEDAW
jgi:alcohol dehydrogenase class IV